MPELPEVQAVASYINESAKGKKIKSVKAFRKDLRFKIPAAIKKIKNEKLKTCDRYGKAMFIHIGDKAIVSHLGMTGQWTYRKQQKPEKHEHLIIYFTNSYELVYKDPRRFGYIDYIKNKDIQNYIENKIVGMDPTKLNYKIKPFRETISNKKTPIKAFLLNQKHIAGVGNIYASEILYKAKIHPERSCEELDKDEVALVFKHTKKVLEEAIKMGGTTIRDFYVHDKTKGNYKTKLKVYDRQGKKCTTCRSEILKITQSGRATYFCDACQV